MVVTIQHPSAEQDQEIGPCTLEAEVSCHQLSSLIFTVFGADTGYNQQSTTCKYVLANSNFASFYTSAYPMATYKPGQEVCLAWPAKK